MNLVSFLLRASRSIVVLSTFAGLVSGAAGVGLIAVIHAELGREDPSSQRLGLAFVGLCLLAGLARVIAQVAMVRLAQGTVCELCVHLCRRILAVPFPRFENLNPSALVAVLTEDIAIVANGLVGIPLIGINLPIVVICLAYVGWLSPPVLVCGVAVAVPAIVGYEWLAVRGVRQLTRARGEQDRLVGHFRTLIDGFRELTLHRGRRTAFVDDQLQCSAETVRDRNTSGLSTFALAGSWSQAAFFGFIGVLLFVLPAFVSLSRPTLAGAVLVVLYIMSPLDIIVTWIPILGRTGVSLRKIQSLDPSLGNADQTDPLAPSSRSLEKKPAATWPDSRAPAAKTSFDFALELSNVTYTYHHSSEREGFVLGPIDLTLRPEEIVFLVGGNGSGKTTLLKLLTGLYAPEMGELRIDGRPITAETQEEYRQLISVVFADGHLFSSLFGLDDVNLDTRARDGLARLGLAGLVDVTDGTFSTLNLSQGQRKRLALLSAELEDRPLCILDEWASYQDPNFKRTFYTEILPEWRARGKTLVVVTHDEDYFHVADRVIRLDSGRIVDGESGGGASRNGAQATAERVG